MSILYDGLLEYIVKRAGPMSTYCVVCDDNQFYGNFSCPKVPAPIANCATNTSVVLHYDSSYSIKIWVPSTGANGKNFIHCRIHLRESVATVSRSCFWDRVTTELESVDYCYSNPDFLNLVMEAINNPGKRFVPRSAV